MLARSHRTNSSLLVIDGTRRTVAAANETTEKVQGDVRLSLSAFGTNFGLGELQDDTQICVGVYCDLLINCCGRHCCVSATVSYTSVMA